MMAKVRRRAISVSRGVTAGYGMGRKGRIIPPLPPSPGIGSQAATILALCRAAAAATPRRGRQGDDDFLAARKRNPPGRRSK